jgi:hypothetical protein
MPRMPDNSILPINQHHEIGETFADQLGTMYFDGTSLRMDLMVTRVEKPTNPPMGERHVVCRLVLSPRCTVDMINQLKMLSAQLAQAGFLKPEPPAPKGER